MHSIRLPPMPLTLGGGSGACTAFFFLKKLKSLTETVGTSGQAIDHIHLIMN